MRKILVSACLLGRPVRYDGSAKSAGGGLLQTWEAEGRLVAICPELSAGFGVPRPPAEIAGAASGDDVLTGNARVVEATGADVTNRYVAGAQAALDLALANGCAFALLVDRSPSCGSNAIYDGTFSGASHFGAGVTTALLRQHGVEVYAETAIEALAERLAR